MVDRKLIFDAIDNEREYQDRRVKIAYPDRKPDSEQLVHEWASHMSYYYYRVMEDLELNDNAGALENILKIAALAVRTMEIHGIPTRNYDKYPEITAIPVNDECTCDKDNECCHKCFKSDG